MKRSCYVAVVLCCHTLPCTGLYTKRYNIHYQKKTSNGQADSTLAMKKFVTLYPAGRHAPDGNSRKRSEVIYC